MIEAGTRLGSYEVLSQLGAGGMGEVYRARDTKLGRDVALKLLPGEFTRDPERVARFKREAQVLASLKSGHVVYMHQGTVFAAPFHLGRLEVTGPSVPAIEAVASTVQTGGVQFSASDTGAVVYLPGRSITNAAPIHWLDRTGKASPLRATPSGFIFNFFDELRRIAPAAK